MKIIFNLLFKDIWESIFEITQIFHEVFYMKSKLMYLQSNMYTIKKW